jgi:hypothetical protein
VKDTVYSSSFIQSPGNRELIALLAKNILENPLAPGRNWSVQGLGMMRFYLNPNVRLHIWDRSLRVPGVSPIHTHPWNFTSYVVVGVVDNIKYDVGEKSGEAASRVQIQCGSDAVMTGEVEALRLRIADVKTIRAGYSYWQDSREIHQSQPADGTVTLVVREPLTDPDHADVYWFGDGAWVDAKPRAATNEEVLRVTQHSLEIWK